MTQKFKGDTTELRMEAAAQAAFEACSLSKTDMFQNGYQASDFLLMLYDEGRMPFSARVPREAFVAFIREAIPNFRFTGTFESYMFILKAIFGQTVEVLFTVPGPGQLEIEVNAGGSTIDFDFVAKSFVDGGFVLDELVDHTGDQLVLASIVGIESEGQLIALFDELIPAGIFTEITLNFFEISQFIADYDGLGTEYTIIASNGDEIVFYEP